MTKPGARATGRMADPRGARSYPARYAPDGAYPASARRWRRRPTWGVDLSQDARLLHGARAPPRPRPGRSVSRAQQHRHHQPRPGARAGVRVLPLAMIGERRACHLEAFGAPMPVTPPRRPTRHVALHLSLFDDFGFADGSARSSIRFLVDRDATTAAILGALRSRAT